MTNQQGAPEALTDFERRHAIRQGHEIAASDGYFEARPQIDSNDRRKVFQAGFERGWDRHAAMVEAQQPAPSAAAAVGQEPNFNLLRKALADRRFRGETDLQDLVNMAANIIAEDGAILRARRTIIEQLKTAAKPSHTPQADSQPAPQGETNAQLDTDSNSPTPGQQRDVAGPVAVGQPVGHGSDSTAGDPSAQRNKLLTVAERNIRSFLRSAVFKSESDREAALNCVDVLWEAARAPAGSEVTRLRAALVYTAYALHATPQYMLAEGITLIDGDTVRVSRDGWTVEASVNPARAAQPAQAADSVLEDAARYRWLAAHCRSTSGRGGGWSIVVDGPAPKSHDSEDDFDAAIDAARKQGGAT